MLNNRNYIFEGGKTYVAGIDFIEGLIEMTPLTEHASGTYYKFTDIETGQINKFSGAFNEPQYIKMTKGSKLELYVDVMINTYTREDHILFSSGFYEAGEDFRAGLVEIINRKNSTRITIHNGDTFEAISVTAAAANSEFYLKIEKGQLLRTYDGNTELIEYRKI